MARDELYEASLFEQLDKVMRLLDNYYEKIDDVAYADLLSIERALQISVEAFIGLSRYALQQCHDIRVTRSREAIDELYEKKDFSKEEYDNILKMIGFRNTLVHDYLKVNEAIVRAVIKNKLYQQLNQYAKKLRALISAP
ncbi:MAG: hypothetical protein DHS20C10_12780 [marine bacterium B5-7]|nr:MAG: hypothetical protein DHS20C10_12780 [marine bacterium B5-7]